MKRRAARPVRSLARICVRPFEVFLHFTERFPVCMFDYRLAGCRRARGVCTPSPFENPEKPPSGEHLASGSGPASVQLLKWGCWRGRVGVSTGSAGVSGTPRGRCRPGTPRGAGVAQGPHGGPVSPRQPAGVLFRERRRKERLRQHSAERLFLCWFPNAICFNRNDSHI